MLVIKQLFAIEQLFKELPLESFNIEPLRNE
jgi:hypothetical protein